MIKAVSLFSGGLDSLLATQIIMDQGIEVIAVNFIIPFANNKKMKEKQYYARNMSQKMGIELVEIELRENFLDLLRNPKYDFGKNLNPCIDCKILMITQAYQVMKEKKASFIVTGEVLSQRPKSQFLWGLSIIDRDSHIKGLILRPLSAKLLQETIPEQKGWVDRDKLYNFSGRVRGPQFDLAQKMGITDYPAPAGGCLLTDPIFARRVYDLLIHDELTMENIELLKLGRYFRLSNQFIFLVGRNEKDNLTLFSQAKPEDYIFTPSHTKGPTGLGKGMIDSDTEQFASGIIAYYSSSLVEPLYIKIQHQSYSSPKMVQPITLSLDQIEKYRIENFPIKIIRQNNQKTPQK
jgi:tRNA-specific 2-thiouridylase